MFFQFHKLYLADSVVQFPNGVIWQVPSKTHAHMVNLSLIKEARIDNGEKTASSISGAGKTGQLHVKE